MKKALILTMALLTVAAFAEQVNVFTCGFEEGEGFSTGTIAGQNGWSLNGTEMGQMTIVDTASYAGDQSFRIYHPEQSWGDNDAIKTISYENPYEVDVHISYMVKPGNNYCSFGPKDKNNQLMFNLYVGKNEIGGDLPTYTSKGVSLNPDQWCPVEILISPKTSKIKSVTVGDYVLVSPSEEPRDYYGSASGDLGKLVFFTKWHYMTETFVDNISVDLVPEPASMGLLALLGLCFLRKRA